MTRPTPTRRDHYKRLIPVQMRWADTDIYGHMNNAVHYTLFDTAVQIFLTENGLLDLDESPSIFLVVSSGCDYFEQITFGNALTAGLKIRHLGNSSVQYEIGLFQCENETAAATGHFTHVSVSRATGKPRTIPMADRAIFETLS